MRKNETAPVFTEAAPNQRSQRSEFDRIRKALGYPRRREQDELAAAIEAAGPGASLGIEGPCGTGKSALVPILFLWHERVVYSAQGKSQQIQMVDALRSPAH